MNKKFVQYLYMAALTVLILLPVVFFTFFGKYFDTTNYENRVLAAKPTLALSTLETYPADFENYFNDYLPFRNQLVFLNGMIDYKVFKTSSSDSVIVGKDGWLFYKGAQVNDEDPISDYNGSNLFSEEELEQIRTNMLAARDELEARGMDFVIMIAPNKERVYSEYMPDSYGEPEQQGRMWQVVEYLRTTTDLTVVCPYDALLAYKEEHPEWQYYYKYDTHWNNMGAYIGGRELNAALGFEMPDLTECTIMTADSPVFDLAKLLHLGQYLQDDTVYVVGNYTTHALESESNEDNTEFRYHNPNGDGAQEKLFIIGDSFSTMMAPYVACNYNDTYLNFYYNYSLEILEREEPTVVVYETVERYMKNMLNFSITDGVGTQAAQ
ncbi:MAG: hypothetical protein Q4C60_02490 [Eubacteriales bacterium]|nr:hypothetical protein [Eubacteriales bacterium]